MTDKELRKLKRADLIEILYYMREKIDSLTAENERLYKCLDVIGGKTSDTTESADPVQISEGESSDE